MFYTHTHTHTHRGALFSLLALVVTLLLIPTISYAQGLNPAPEPVVYGGDVGTNVHWEIAHDTLTLSVKEGETTGTLPVATESSLFPWNYVLEHVVKHLKIVLKDGQTLNAGTDPSTGYVSLAYLLSGVCSDLDADEAVECLKEGINNFSAVQDISGIFEGATLKFGVESGFVSPVFAHWDVSNIRKFNSALTCIWEWRPGDRATEVMLPPITNWNINPEADISNLLGKPSFGKSILGGQVPPVLEFSSSWEPLADKMLSMNVSDTSKGDPVYWRLVDHPELGRLTTTQYFTNWTYATRSGLAIRASSNPDGWYRDADYGWFYMYEGKRLQGGWAFIDDAWYYFNDDGYISTNCWQWINDAWYGFWSGGQMCTGWVWDSGYNNWFYCDVTSGAMYTNCWAWIGDAWYGFWSDGEMCYGWIWDSGYQAWFYCDWNAGWMYTNRWVDQNWWAWDNGVCQYY